MPKNIRIVPSDYVGPSGPITGGYVLFESRNGKKIAMLINDDGSIQFSGASKGSELVKFTAGSGFTDVQVKGNLNFDDDVYFDNNDSINSSNSSWIGAMNGIKGDKGIKVDKGQKDLK